MVGGIKGGLWKNANNINVVCDVIIKFKCYMNREKSKKNFNLLSKSFIMKLPKIKYLMTTSTQ